LILIYQWLSVETLTICVSKIGFMLMNNIYPLWSGLLFNLRGIIELTKDDVNSTLQLFIHDSVYQLMVPY